MRRSLSRTPMSTAPMGLVASRPTRVMTATATTEMNRSWALSDHSDPNAVMRGMSVRPLNPPVTSRHCSATCSRVSDSTRVKSPMTTGVGRRRNAATATPAETVAPTSAATSSAGRVSAGAAAAMRAVV